MIVRHITCTKITALVLAFGVLSSAAQADQRLHDLILNGKISEVRMRTILDELDRKAASATTKKLARLDPDAPRPPDGKPGWQTCKARVQSAQYQAQHEAARKLLEQAPDAYSTTVTATVAQGAVGYHYRLAGRAGSDGQATPTCGIHAELVVPHRQRVQLRLTSHDEIYDLNSSVLKIAASAIPGRLASVDLGTSMAGTFDGVVTRQDGDRKTSSAFQVRILTPEAYRVWERDTLNPAPCK